MFYKILLICIGRDTTITFINLSYNHYVAQPEATNLKVRYITFKNSNKCRFRFGKVMKFQVSNQQQHQTYMTSIEVKVSKVLLNSGLIKPRSKKADGMN